MKLRFLAAFFCVVACTSLLTACGKKSNVDAGSSFESGIAASESQSEASVSLQSESGPQPPSSSQAEPVSSEASSEPDEALQETKLPMYESYPLAYVEIYKLLRDSPFTEHTISLENFYVNHDKVPNGHIVYQAPQDCFTGAGGGGVICFPAEMVFENPERYDIDPNIKFGEFQIFGHLKNWVLYDSEDAEVIRIQDYNDEPDVEMFISDERVGGALKETDKHQRFVGNAFNVIAYIVDLGQGYGASVYFYAPPELNGQDLAVYDKIAESMVIVLD